MQTRFFLVDKYNRANRAFEIVKAEFENKSDAIKWIKEQPEAAMYFRVKPYWIWKD